MFIKNVNLYMGAQSFCPGAIRIQEGYITEVYRMKEGKEMSVEMPTFCVSTEEIIDGEGAYALPGFIDMHFHGCVGKDVSDVMDTEKESLTLWQKIAEFQMKNGVTTMAPAMMTLSPNSLDRVLKQAADFAGFQKQSEDTGAWLAGIQMEGPYISPRKCGAQDVSCIQQCSLEQLEHWQRCARGLIKVIGIAPEEGIHKAADREDSQGIANFIKEASKHMTVSLSHTNADYETARKAFEVGASHVTHLFNAMSPWHHREPGVVGAAMDAVFSGKKIMAELICDGNHVHDSLIRSTFKLLGKEHLVLISDSIRATGLGDGEYLLGGQPVQVRGNLATLKGTNTLAGSVITLADCVRYVVKKVGIPLEEVIDCVTINPAKCLKVDACTGSLQVGKRADILLWDKDLRTKMVVCRGKVWGAEK